MVTSDHIQAVKTLPQETVVPGWRAITTELACKTKARINEYAKADASRLVLWTPVVIGSGAGFYFWLKQEPTFWVAPVLAIFLLSAITATNAFPRMLRVLLLIVVGFCAADLRTQLVEAPTLEKELTPRLIEGRLISVGEAAKSRRLVIAVQSIDRLGPEETPDRIRINWRGKAFGALPGDDISLRAGLLPPPPPVAPGAFDFARQLYFQRIGAVGYAVTPPRVLEDGERSFAGRIKIRIEQLRLSLARRIVSVAPGEGGAIVAAVVTGKRDAITERAENALRDSGLAHLLAISGLHMGLATGLIFFAVRGGLALSEPLALNYPIKKWAAMAALGAGFFYLLLSGGGWSARRAFIMAAVIFVAIIADRRALSLRNVAIAATFILLTTPEALLHPGFQMSFAAVTALIAAYEWASGRASPDRSFSVPAKFKRYAIGVGVTDTIAAVATAPFALYHFNRVAIYSLPANMVAMPLMAFWIMPCAVIALALTPFGLDAWAWGLSAAGVEFILAAASWVSAKPGAISLTAQWPLLALLILTIGGLWFCLQSVRWRYAGLIALPISALIIASAKPPDLFVARSGENAGLVTHDVEGEPVLAVFNRRKNRFEARAWKEYVGLDVDENAVHAMKDHGRCDIFGCVIETKDGTIIAVSSKPSDLVEDCNRADLVITTYPVSSAHWRACKARLIDRRSVWNHGAHAVWLKKETAIKIRTVGKQRGDRPWTG